MPVFHCNLIAVIAMVCAVSLVGCEQAQYESAVDDYQEKKAEAVQTAEGAMQDGVLDSEEVERVQEQVDQAHDAYGDVAEKKGDLIESELD